MSESEDSKDVDNSVYLPENRFTNLLHPNFSSAQLKSLQAIVRYQKQEEGEIIYIKTDFEVETEDESSSKKENR